eukprot:maker-scaffold108_size357748-snap-gene-2.18 protein:Tk09443 transcript:maker-scaffold108_size357748-snap-gene-2.18-mRNA-1 annotation:"protein fez"
MAHLFKQRATGSQGQIMDIYENPSEHYMTTTGAGNFGPGLLRTVEATESGATPPNLRPHYFMEGGANGPQLRVGYGPESDQEVHEVNGPESSMTGDTDEAASDSGGSSQYFNSSQPRGQPHKTSSFGKPLQPTILGRDHLGGSSSQFSSDSNLSSSLTPRLSRPHGRMKNSAENHTSSISSRSNENIMN